VAFRQALALGDDPELNRYFLASLSGEDAPPTPPLRYVEMLFDGYADKFDQHLVQVLHYQAHRLVVEQVSHPGRSFARALDLGCGTGLCAPLARPIAHRLEGVDISAAMLAKAQALGLYDQLTQADLVSYLSSTPRRYDCVVAADVFIYVGALEPVFDGVARVLEPGGVFGFSVEIAPDECDFALRPSQRYAHSERYLRTLALRHGFEVRSMLHRPIREDQARPIAGLYACLQAVGG
jgi:predicted TPR repeat methyltransferase